MGGAFFGCVFARILCDKFTSVMPVAAIYGVSMLLGGTLLACFGGWLVGVVSSRAERLMRDDLAKEIRLAEYFALLSTEEAELLCRRLVAGHRDQFLIRRQGALLLADEDTDELRLFATGDSIEDEMGIFGVKWPALPATHGKGRGRMAVGWTHSDESADDRYTAYLDLRNGSVGEEDVDFPYTKYCLQFRSLWHWFGFKACEMIDIDPASVVSGSLER